MIAALDELLASHEANRDCFDRLRACVERGDLTPFVGAGMSRDSDYPLWSDFVRNMGKRALIPNEIEELLRTGDYEGVLDKVHAKLEEALTRKEIKRCFGPSRLNKERLGGAILHLPVLVSGPVITTNYDCVLESLFHYASRDFHKVVIGGRRDAVRDALFEKQPFLLKMHGTFDEADGQLLTRADYDTHYGSKVDGKFDPNLLLPKLLFRIFGSRELLFLGCSLTIDRTMALLDYLHKDRHDAPAAHFAIVSQEATAEATLEREKFLVSHNIEPIFYPHGEYGAVEILLSALPGKRAVSSYISSPYGETAHGDMPHREPGSYDRRKEDQGKLMKSKEQALLQALYSALALKGSAELDAEDVNTLAQPLCLSPEETFTLVEQLRAEGLVTAHSGGRVSLTPEGRDRAEGKVTHVPEVHLEAGATYIGPSAHILGSAIGPHAMGAGAVRIEIGAGDLAGALQALRVNQSQLVDPEAQKVSRELGDTLEAVLQETPKSPRTKRR